MSRERRDGSTPIHKRTPSLQGTHNQDKALYIFGISEEEFARHKALIHLGANEPVYKESLRVIRHHPLENRCDLDEYDEAIILSSDKRRQSIGKLRSMLGRDWSHSYKAHQRLGTSPSEVLEKRSRELASLDPRMYFESQQYDTGSSSSSAPNSASPPPIALTSSVGSNSSRQGRTSHRRVKSQSSWFPFGKPRREHAVSSPPSLHSRSPSPNSSLFSKMLSFELGKIGHNMTQTDLIGMWDEISHCLDHGVGLDTAISHVYDVFPRIFLEFGTPPAPTPPRDESERRARFPAMMMGGRNDEKEQESHLLLLEEKADEVVSPPFLTSPPASASNKSVYVSLLKCNLVCSVAEYVPRHTGRVAFFVDENSKHFHDMSAFLFALRTGYFLSGFEDSTLVRGYPFFCNNIVDFFYYFGPMIRRYNSNSTPLHMAVSCIFDEIDDKNAPYTKWSDKLKKAVFILCYLLHMGFHLRDKNPNGGTSPIKMLQNHAPRVFKHVCFFSRYLTQIYISEFHAICENLSRCYFDIHLANLIAAFTFHNHSFTYKPDQTKGMPTRVDDIPPETLAIITDFHELNKQVTRHSRFFHVAL